MILGMFEKAYYINLDSRTDRRTLIESELAKVGIEAERFPAIRPTQPDGFLSIGHNGCVHSHLAVVKKAKEAGLKNVLIIEDDCVFNPKFLEEIPAIIADLKTVQWGIFTFYHNNEKLIHVTDNISKSDRICDYTHFYAINSTSYDIIIQKLENTRVALTNTLRECDINVFCSNIGLAGQRFSKSDDYDTDNITSLWFQDGKINFDKEVIAFVIHVIDHSDEQIKWCIEHLKKVYTTSPVIVLSERDLTGLCSQNNVKFVLGKPWDKIVDIWIEHQSEWVLLISPFVKINRKFTMPNKNAYVFGTKINEIILDKNFVGMRYEFIRKFSGVDTSNLDINALCNKIHTHPVSFKNTISLVDITKKKELIKKLKISFCTTCKGRLWQLSQVIRQNIQDNLEYQNVEFVLVNYNSPDGLDEWVKNNLQEYIDLGILSYYKLLEDKPWNVSHAKNIAHRLATGDVLCNLDSDNFTGDDLSSFINSEIQKHPEMIGQIHGGRHGTYGRIFLTSKLFAELGGYDESFLPMAYQDVDLMKRAELLGVEKIVYNKKFEFMTVIPNDTAAKTTFCDGKTLTEMNDYNTKISASNIKNGIFKVNSNGWGKCKVLKNFTQTIVLE